MNVLISLSGTYILWKEKKKNFLLFNLWFKKYVNLFLIQYSWFFYMFYINLEHTYLGESVIDYIKETTILIKVHKVHKVHTMTEGIFIHQ